MSETTPFKHFGAALLLDALVFPGAGHWFAGFTRRGAAMIVASLLLLFVPLFRYVAGVAALIQQPLARHGMPMSTLATLGTTWHAQRGFILGCLAGIVLIWIYGIVDLILERRRSA